MFWRDCAQRRYALRLSSSAVKKLLFRRRLFGSCIGGTVCYIGRSMEVLRFNTLRREFDAVAVKLRSCEDITQKQVLTDKLAQLAAQGNRMTQGDETKGKRKRLVFEFQDIAGKLAGTADYGERQALIKRSAQLIRELQAFSDRQAELALAIREKLRAL
jgi:hypothetical protein